MTLNSSHFLDQLDELQIEMTLSEIPSKRFNRKQIYNWLRSWISAESTNNLEKLLRFITGTTRIPLTKKITVSIIMSNYVAYYLNIFIMN